MAVNIGSSELLDAYVGPVDDRQPTANTIAYLPMQSNANDEIGNLTLSNSGTQETIGRTFSGTINWTENKSVRSNIRFVNTRLKVNSGLNGTSCCTQLFDIPVSSLCYVTSHSSSQRRNTVHGNSSSDTRPYGNTGIEQGKRYNLVYGYDTNNQMVMRVNGVKTVIYTGGVKTSTAFQFIRQNGVGVNITVSRFIYESAVRSDDEVVKYYEKTKEKFT